MYETIPGPTNKEIVESVQPAMDAAKEAGGEVFHRNVDRLDKTRKKERFGTHFDDHIIIESQSTPNALGNREADGKIRTVNANLYVPTTKGGETSYHAYRNEGAVDSQSGVNIRRDVAEGEGGPVYEAHIKNPKAVELVAKLAAKSVVRQAEKEKERNLPKAA